MSPMPRKPCGTYTAYKRHIREKTTPCQPCRDAMAEHTKEQRREAAARKTNEAELGVAKTPALSAEELARRLHGAPLDRATAFVQMIARGARGVRPSAMAAGLPYTMARQVAHEFGYPDLGKLAQASDDLAFYLLNTPAKQAARVDRVQRVEVPVEVVKEVRVEVPVEKVVEKTVEVPVEVATRYLDHPSPAVQRTARIIADQYRLMEALVQQHEAFAQVEVPQAGAVETTPVHDVKNLHCPRWTPQEDARLLAWTGDIGDLVDEMGRTRSALRQRRVKLCRLQQRKEAA